MPHTAIEVKNLYKQFFIGTTRNRNDTLRDWISSTISAPVRYLNGLGKSVPPKNSDQLAEGTIWALQDISVRIQAGEVFGIVGRNGAGKSTLLKILSRITEPTRGRAVVYGRVGSLLEVGTGFHPELTGRENIFLNGAILGMHRTEIRRKFDEIVAFAEIEKFLELPVKRYSSGMYVRLAFAVAAHLEPEILLVDEVLAVGDAAFQRKCLGKMDDVAREGRTILFVSHNMNAIQRLCPKSILLESGQLLMNGPTPEIVKAYLSSGAGAVQPDQWIDISDQSRGGTGEAKFNSIRFTSSNPNTHGNLYTDGPLKIDLVIDARESRSIGSMAVTIYDQYGTKLVNADSLALGKNIYLNAGQNEISFHIHQLHLNPGVYILGLWMANPSGDVFDTLSSVVKIEVFDLQSEKLGSRPKADGLVTCNFEIIEAE